MTKYLISKDGSLGSLIRNRDDKIIFVENISEIHKAIEIWAEDLQVNVDFNSIKIDFALQTVALMWDYDEIAFGFGAEWTLLEIDKP